MRTAPSRRRSTLLSVAVVALAGSLLSGAPPPAQAATALTAFYVDSGWMAPTRATYQTQPGSTFTATYDTATGTASIDIDTSGDDTKTWRLKFAAPPGEQLGVGSYPGAVRWPFNGAGQPGFSLTRLYQGCNEESGEFTISEWQLDGSTITAFAVSFIHECETGLFGLSRGELRVGSSIGLKAVLPYLASIDFGDAVTGRPTASKALTVAARGNVAATISSVTLAGDDPGDFEKTADTCTGATLAPGATCTVKVRMVAKAAWDRYAKLAIADDTFPGKHEVALSGRGLAYSFGPTALDFGSQPVLTRGRASVTVRAGLEALTGWAFNIEGSSPGYDVPSSNCAEVKALGTCRIIVEFRPTTVGPANDSYLWGAISAGSSYDYISIPLKGTGVKTSAVAWGTDRTAGRNYTWSHGKAMGRTVSGTTTYLHVIEATDYIGGKWATNSGPYMGVYYVRTSNAGSTWTTSRRLNPSTKHAERSALTASGSNVYAAWVSQTKIGSTYSPTAARVLYVRTNTNHGSTTAWRSTVRVSSSTGRVDYPAIAASGSNVYVTYTDANTGNIRLAISRDRGATWTYKTIGTTSHSTSDGKAGYPAVAVSGTRVIVSWTLNNDFKIVARSSVDSGATWAAQATIATTAGSESVAAAGTDRFVVGWTDVDGARLRTHKAGAWGTITSIKVNTTNPYTTHWTPAIALNGTSGTAIAWGACVSRCDTADTISDLIWAESADGGSTFPHLQVLASTDEGNVWSPSIVWQKADARHVLYEKDCCGYDSYRLRIRTGTGAPK